MKEFEKRSIGPATLVPAVLTLAGGIWQILAPFALNYGGITILDAASKKQVPAGLGAVTATDIVTGVLLIGLGLAILLLNGNQRLQKYAFIGTIVVGLFLMVAPYLYDLFKVVSYMGMDKPNTNDQLIGILAVIVGGFALQRQMTTAEEVESGTLPAAI